jgi:Trk-type K+ transport system membrane component
MYPNLNWFSNQSKQKNIGTHVIQTILILLQILGIVASIVLLIDLLTRSQIFYSKLYYISSENNNENKNIANIMHNLMQFCIFNRI